MLAQSDARVLPSFGLHPWKAQQVNEAWREQLLDLWGRFPNAGVGEIGLDRWIEGYDIDAQLEAFSWQFAFASEENRPASIHCLKAWGLLYDLLRESKRPERGFLLHAYGGPKEMVKPLAELGAYFSFSGYFAWARKGKQREAFREVPLERLLIETDAPDMRGPAEVVEVELEGDELNHPLNLPGIYRYAAKMFDQDLEPFAAQVEANWRRFFDRPATAQ